MQQDPADMTPEDLSHAGSVVDKAIEYMMEQQIAPISIASALLGGALACWRVPWTTAPWPPCCAMHWPRSRTANWPKPASLTAARPRRDRHCPHRRLRLRAIAG